jgi:hypothetical protein
VPPHSKSALRDKLAEQLGYDHPNVREVESDILFDNIRLIAKKAAGIKDS